MFSNPVESRQEVGRCLNGKIETRGSGGHGESCEISINSPFLRFIFCWKMINFIFISFRIYLLFYMVTNT
jgi:hypothetical protein